MNPETLANLVIETDQPIQIGGGLDQPPMAGKRTLENSPALFPHLSLEGCRFLEGVANVAICLEEQLSFPLTSPQNILFPPFYTPSSITDIVDIANMLVSTPAINSRDSRENGSRPTYSLSYASVPRQDIKGFEMQFSTNEKPSIPNRSNRLNRPNRNPVTIFLQPNTIRQTFDPEGNRLWQYDGFTATEVMEMESSRRKPLDKVMVIVEGYRETHPSFTITSGKAKFMITFHQDAADCDLVIEGKNYYYGGYYYVDYYVAQKSIPLTNFRSSGSGNPPSQEDVDLWLQNLVSEMDAKVKRPKQKRGPV